MLSSLIPRASLSRLCPRRSPKEKKATHIFAPPHNSLVLCSLLVKSLPLRARQNRRELNGRKKARKRNYQHNPDSWLKVKENTVRLFPLSRETINHPIPLRLFALLLLLALWFLTLSLFGFFFPCALSESLSCNTFSLASATVTDSSVSVVW